MNTAGATFDDLMKLVMQDLVHEVHRDVKTGVIPLEEVFGLIRTAPTRAVTLAPDEDRGFAQGADNTQVSKIPRVTFGVTSCFCNLYSLAAGSLVHLGE